MSTTQRRYRVLYITPEAGMEMGGQVSLFHLLANLDTTVFEPLLVTPEEGELTRRMRRLGHPFFLRKFGSVKPKRIIRIIRDIFWLTRLITSERIDIVHTDRSTDTFHAVIASFFKHVSVVWHVRVTIPNPIDRFNGRFVKRIIGVSRDTALRFPKKHRQSPKFTCIYNGVDLKLFDQDERTIEESRSFLTGGRAEHVVLSVAQIVKRKGIYELVKAAARVLETHPQVVFAVAGDGRNLEVQNVQDLITELGVEGNVKLLGYRDDVPGLLIASDIVVLASHDDFEGCPRAVIEAMAAGKPVVATDVKGTREVVWESTGVLVPQKDAGALAQAISFLITDGEKRRRMGEEARKIVRERFTIQEHTSRVQRIYEEMLNFHSGSPGDRAS